MHKPVAVGRHGLHARYLRRVLCGQGVSCCRQLSSVLAWLWGELACGAASAGARAPLAPRTSHIHTLFSHRIWAKQTLNQAPKTNSTAASARGCTAARTKHNGVAKLDSDSKGPRHSLAQSEPSTESADSDDDLHILNKSVSIKVQYMKHHACVKGESEIVEKLCS
ncbi:PREDICTED: uncharacterized protein LOC106106378 [Papilio polytes]|uniref:uncharacterized protein LOC106106378 n=1 Tax=Papilio polytes TaxID=76194 RepID=UPI000675C9FE|nr:PREDICTED: uncharacterized protein LOC106106378 [Papilio polytes]